MIKILYLVALQFLIIANSLHSLTIEQVSIIQNFRSQGFYDIIDDIKIVKPDKSAYVDYLIFLKANDGVNYAIKTYSDDEGFVEENKLFLADQAIMKDHDALVERSKFRGKLPTIMRYFAGTLVNFTSDKTEEHHKGAVLLSKAEGKTIRELSDDIFNTDAQKVKTTFYEIGRQCGNIDALYYRLNEKTRLNHPDAKLDNFIFNEEDNQLHWIDTAGLSVVRASDFKSNHNDRLFKSIENTLSSVVDRLSVATTGGEVNIAEVIKLRVIFVKRLAAVKSVYAGYADALNEHNMNTREIKDTYRNFCVQMNEKIGIVNRMLQKITLPSIELLDCT